MGKKKSWLAVAVASLLLIPNAFAVNYWELRDNANTTQVTIDGTDQLIGALLNASDVNRGTLPNARLDSSSVTLQGNAFNGVSQLIRTDASGKYPALDGSNITMITASSVPAAGVNAGTLGPAVIASSVAATGVTAGSFGTATAAPTFTVGVDGRLSAASSVTITPAAASITAGSLSATVIASSIAVNAVTDASIVSVSGTKVIGNISGNAGNITGNLAASQLSAGTLSGAFTFTSSTTVNALVITGAVSAASLRTLACPSSTCLAFNTTDFDLYTSTGASAGSWRNSRTGVAP